MDIRGAVVVIVDLWNNKILMIERHEAPGKFGLIGGTVEKGETPRVAAVREFAEETGVSLSSDLFSMRPIVASVDDHGNFTEAFLCCASRRRWPEDRSMGPEGTQLAWIPFEDLKNPLISAFPIYNNLVWEALHDGNSDPWRQHE